MSDKSIQFSFIPENEERNKWFNNKQGRIADAYMKLARMHELLGSELNTDSKILELGSGLGYFLKYGEELGYKCYGIDLKLNPEMVSKRNIAVATGNSLPFADSIFDVVFEDKYFCDMFEFQGVSSNRFQEHYDEVRRVLRPGGYFIGHMDPEYFRRSKDFTRMPYSYTSNAFYRKRLTSDRDNASISEKINDMIMSLQSVLFR